MSSTSIPEALFGRNTEPTSSEYVERNRHQFGGGLNDFTTERYQRFAQHLPPDTRTVLDVGCNSGVGASPLRTAVPAAELIGLDCVPERVAEARKHFDLVHEGLANQLPLPDSSACAVLAGELIEHLTIQDARSFLHEVYRVLRPGGRCILTTPNPHYLKLALTGRRVLDDPAHLTAFSIRTMRQELSQVGLRVRVIEGSGRVSRKIGRRVPLLFLYGSYLLVAEKAAREGVVS